MQPGGRSVDFSGKRLILLNFLRLTVLVLVASAASGTAWAQIYSWRDANGTLVLSDHPPASATGGIRTFAVPKAEGIRVTKPGARTYPNLYDDLIEQHARDQGVRPDLVRAVIQVESGFNPRAVSRKGARGLMQLMPRTAFLLGVRNPFDPAENIRAGVTYLRQLLDKYRNEELALAAYNAGETAVGRYGNRVPPYRETRDYVRRVRGVSATPAPAAQGKVIYKTVEIVDGRPIPRYSDTRPASGEFEIIAITEK